MIDAGHPLWVPIFSNHYREYFRHWEGEVIGRGAELAACSRYQNLSNHRLRTEMHRYVKPSSAMRTDRQHCIADGSGLYASLAETPAQGV
jgi:hypothetical protein